MNKLIKLSRSTVERYICCPRCCFLEKIYDIRPPSLPFTLNMAVDKLCKNEFDYYREREEPHPLFNKNNIDAIPFKHSQIDNWRNIYKGIRYFSDTYQYDFGGAIDDVWQENNGDLIIVDIKTTSRKTFNWNDIWNKYDYPKSYKRQLEMYQWLFKMNGFKVANEAYIIYFNGKKNEKFFKSTLEFDTHVVKLNCSTDWVEEKILETVDLLRSEIFPSPSDKCENCNYLRKRCNLSKKLGI